MKRILIFMVLSVWGSASGTTYYVSSSSGSDGNVGTSSATAWQTVAKVNGSSFLPGDSVLFKRGDVWNESLTPSSSGTSGKPIAFDAYGTGPAPNLTGYYAVPAAAWVLVTGNAWKAAVPATFSTVNFCLFGSVWGQKVSAVSSNLTAWGNFYLANGFVYVYSQGNPSLFYSGAIVPMALSNVAVINVNGKSWLTFQHFLVNWFDDEGIYVQGASDHLAFANMEADSLIPQGTQPLGFYVNESAPGPGDIKIYNDEAHLNYDAFRFDGAATAISMVNDKAYANRDSALVDNTGAVTYSYCHFYASSLAVAGSTDVLSTSGPGPTAGAGNVATDVGPAVQAWQRYPAEVTLTVDDAGMTAGADTYYGNTVLPVADAAGVPVGVAITVGYPLAQTLISEFQGWINAGRDVTAHSISHTYYTNTNALNIQYTGSGTAASLSVSNKVLTITVTGASDSVSYNLGLSAGQTVGTGIQTMVGLQQALNSTGKFVASLSPLPCQGPYGTGCSAYTGNALLTQDLANVSGQDVKSAAYAMQLNVTSLTTDEISLSRQWMTTNLTGLPTTPVYVYPGGYETTTMQGIAEGVPYKGARGALKEDLGVKDTYADGFNAENITSFGVNPSWQGASGVTPALLNQKIQALVWKEQVWGVPWGIFWHLNELTQNDPVGGTEITNLITDFKNSGAVIQTNTGLVNYLLGGMQVTGTDGSDYYTLPATSMTLDFRPTRSSPVVDAGQNLGTAYALDINGVNQNSYGSGWEIGAHAFIGNSTYGGGAGSGAFDIGSAIEPSLPQLPQVWVDNNEATDGFVYAAPTYELNLATQSWVTAAPTGTGCTFHLPYWTAGAPTAAGLQTAVNDVEACRTAQNACTTVDIPPGLYASSGGMVIPQTNSNAANCFIVLRSSLDANLPNGRTVCAHGMQDNLSSSTDIGMVNPDCTGGNMYYELGPTSLSAATASGVNASMVGTTATFTLATGTFPPTFTSGNILTGAGFAPAGYKVRWTIQSGGAGGTSLTATSTINTGPVSGLGATTTSGTLTPDNVVGGITTLSVNTTARAAVTSAEVTAGVPVLIPLANGYVAPGNAYVVDTGANAETLLPANVPAGGTNQSGLWAIFTRPHASGFSVSYNVGSFTLANGTATNTASYDDEPSMWTVESTGVNQPALTLCSPTGSGASLCGSSIGSASVGPDHWMIEDGEFLENAGNKSPIDIIDMQSGSETSITQLPSHIHFRKDWVHGDWTSLMTGANSIGAGFHLGCMYCSLVDSQASEFLYPGAESHGITYDQGGRSIKANHNWIEGGSIGSLCGGIGPGGFSIAGFIPCWDMEWARNRFTFPYTWLGQSPIANNPNFNSFSLFRKNAFETKEVQRAVIYGNIFENVDASGGQNGPANVFDGANSSSGQGSNYQSIISDIYHASNIMRNTCAAYLISSRAKGTEGGTAFGGGRYWATNDLEYQASDVSSPGCANANNIGIGFDGYQASWQGTCSRDVTGAIATCTLTSGGTGLAETDINVGDHVVVTGCTGDPTFNTATGMIYSGYTGSLLGPAAAPGTVAAGLTVVYGSLGPASSVDTTGTCTLGNLQGYPYGWLYTHNTFVTDKSNAVTTGNNHTSGASFGVNNLFRDSILLGGGFDITTGGIGEGTSAEQFMFDTGSLSADHLVLPGRVNTSYTEYGNHPGFPDLDGCTGAGCTPPATWYFPASDYCGAAVSSSCVGFTGATGTASAPLTAMPLTLSDYHGYELLSGSSFYAGGAEAASDGTSMGPNIPVIDNAQTANTFVCPYACGAPGPYADNIAVVTAPASLFGFTENTTATSNYPTLSYGMQRFWDSPPLQWPFLNTASGAFSFSALDTALAQSYTNGITQSMYTLARTPPWATSNPSDTSCSYSGTAPGLGNGECDAPSDLNSDGSGANAIWKAWITAIAQHVNAAGYTATHTHIKYWEIWNEPDSQSPKFWAGSFAQLARMTEDANCIITGRGVIHQSGNGAATACTATAIDPTAQIVMASAHAVGAALTYGQNELYCNNTGGIPSTELPCPNPANAIAAAVDILNFHMKPGNETGNNCPVPTPCTPESAMQWYVGNIRGILQAAELAKPLWDGEASYSTTGFTGAYTDADMASSFMARFYLVNWSLGITGMAWYTWDQLETEPAQVQTAYQQTYNWLSNSVLTAPCAAVGTVWSCEISKAGANYLILWDTAQSCSGGICTTGNQSVGAQWTEYQDMTSASTAAGIVGHSVAVGIKPVVLH